MTTEEPEQIAITALSYIAADPVLLPRFLSLTGITVSDIRSAAREPGFLGGVLQFIVAHEPTLMDFCEKSGIAPQEVTRAARQLPGGDESWDRQP